MKKLLRSMLVVCASCVTMTTHAQSSYEPYLFTTFAGNSDHGSTNGSGSAARFNSPRSVAVDSAGNVYVADSGNSTIRKITPSDEVVTLAGGAGTSGSADGIGSAAQFNRPMGIAVDSVGTVYVADYGNNTIRKITSAGVVSTLAGLAGDPGSADGTGSAAQFNGPIAIAVDSVGTVYVADHGNNTIRKITSAAAVSTLAGLAGYPGSADGIGSAARFNLPGGLAVDSASNIYVADTYSHTIRQITPAGVVSTLAGLAGNPGSADGIGSTARFYYPLGVAVDSAGNLYVADNSNQTIRKATPVGMVSTVAGLACTPGSSDGAGSTARFLNPGGVAVESTGNVYVADTGNSMIRTVTLGGDVITIAGVVGGRGAADGTGTAARFNLPGGLAADSASNIYVADTYNHTIRKITPAGVVSTLAGSAGSGGSADGAANSARFSWPSAVAVDGSGNVYVADTGNYTVRKITPDGVVSTLAGLAGSPGSADGTGSAARFNRLGAVAVDRSGVIYVADTPNHTIRKISPNGVVSTLAGLAGMEGSADGVGSAARFYDPGGIAVDSIGNVYVADGDNETIRQITPTGVVTTLAGLAGSYGSADGTGNAARFAFPSGIALDIAGNLYVADSGDHTIRKMSPAAGVTTVGGLSADSGGNADGAGSDARFYKPRGVAVDSIGNVYVADTYNHTIRVGTPISALSRKIHGNAGTFDVGLPFAPPHGVECRSPGATGDSGVDYKVIFTFATNVTSCGTAATIGGSVSSGPQSNQCTANLTGVANGQFLTVALNDLQETTGVGFNISVPMGVLVGDTNGDGFVDAVDVSQAKSQSGNGVGNSNFREDANLDGFVDAVDTALVKSKSGTALLIFSSTSPAPKMSKGRRRPWPPFESRR